MKLKLTVIYLIVAVVANCQGGIFDDAKGAINAAANRAQKGVAGAVSTARQAVGSDADEIAELRQNLTSLTEAYNSLCKEIYHISRHVIFHEHALRHIAQAGHKGSGAGHGHHGAGHGHHAGGHHHEHHGHGSEHNHAGHTHENGTDDHHDHHDLHDHHEEHHHANGTDGDHAHHDDHGHHAHHDDHHHDRHASLASDTVSKGAAGVHPDVEMLSGSEVGQFDTSAKLLHHSDDHHDDHHGEGDGHNHTESACANEGNAKWQCSLLHQHACHLGHHDEASNKTFAEQYNQWFKSLISGHGPSLDIGHKHSKGHHHHDGHDDGHHGNATGHDDHHDDHHHGEHKDHAHENVVEQGHDGHDHHGHHHDHHRANRGVERITGHNTIAAYEKVLLGMEDSLVDEDLTYATCDVQPNRDIKSGLRQDVTGKVNMWQRKTGNGPLFTYMKLEGFKVNQVRQVRESVIIPFEVDPEDGSPLREDIYSVHVADECGATSGSDYMGNVRVAQNGELDSEYTFIKGSLSGSNSIAGRTLVIKSKSSDSILTPIACCTITRVAKLPPLADSQGSVNPIRED
ncbi:hypothetical protein HDE_10560 [Halotydeus destructor]|nr:hypothetical protein HDE_10560 [Halotydeus destructor]